MKKRRELDALIGNRTKRDLGNDRIEYDSLNSSLSSPTPDAYIPPSGSYFASAKRVTRAPGKGCGCTLRRMIRICLPVCFLTLVAACITACIGIVWMQVQLKTDVERLSTKIARLEVWQNDQPSALNDMKKTMSEMEVDLNNIKSGENGIQNLAAKLATLTQGFEEQIKVPSEKLGKIQTEMDDTKSVVKELQSSVKDVKSADDVMKASQALLTASFEKIQEKMDEIKTEMSEANVKQLNDIASSKQNSEEGIVKLNSTLRGLKSNLTALQSKVDQLESNQKESQDLLKGIEPVSNTLQKEVASLKKDREQMSQNLVNISRDVSQVKARMAEMNQGGEDNEANAPVPSKQKNSEGDVSNNENLSSTQRQTHTVSLSEILSGIKSKFDTLDKNQNGVLSRDELISVYGTDAGSALMMYDIDHDGSLSKTEISNAISAVIATTTERQQQRKSTKR